jgi:prepilin-type N-terminal cleavage/methylation domain-containing protein
MLTNRLHPRRTARCLSRGGFTLVELLVVIGIIAILAGVALGPITSGIKKAKQNTGMQAARTIALAEFSFANDHEQAYPDTGVPTGNTSTGAAAVAAPLIAGGYTSDPGTYYISGDASASKYSGTSTITSNQISYDFLGNGGSGISSNFPDQVPIVWSSTKGGTDPTITSAQGTAVTAVPVATGPFGTDGMAVCFKSNSAKFVVTDKTTGTPTCTLVDTSWVGGVPTTALVLHGDGG